MTKIEIQYTDGNGTAYAYCVPEGMQIDIGDLVQVPRTWIGATQGRVCSLETTYPGGCDHVIRILEKAVK